MVPVMSPELPKWATEERKRHLVRLFLRSGGFCVFGHKPCPCPELHHYEPFIEGLIRDWIAEDRAQAEAEWQAERERMHRVPDTRFRQGRFDTVSRVEIGSALQGLSKSKRRKASRYGKPIPKESQDSVGRLIEKAVAHWWNR
jgi:hypothetical protein